MRQALRRIVTGHDQAGRSNISINDDAPNVIEVKGWPGLLVAELWVTGEMPVDNMGKADQGARRVDEATVVSRLWQTAIGAD